MLEYSDNGHSKHDVLYQNFFSISIVGIVNILKRFVLATFYSRETRRYKIFQKINNFAAPKENLTKKVYFSFTREKQVTNRY